MAFSRSCILCSITLLSLLFGLCFSEENVAIFRLEFSYVTRFPLGVPQQVIAVNGKFPGPQLNVTTNYVVVVNVTNKLDEGLLITWPGLKMRRAFWQDGVLGTNCPIPPNESWSYQVQAKDQVGSFFYFPSLNLQRTAGGFGSFIISNNLSVVSLPFNLPDGDIVVFIGDWYNQSPTALRKALDNGTELGIPDGVLINGKGPYNKSNSVAYETINVDPGKAYRIRVHNVGVSTCLNFGIQNHKLVLVETEGQYTIPEEHTSFDIHVGQSYSFLVTTMNEKAISSDYYIIASPKFVKANESYDRWKRVTGVAILHYSSYKGKATGPLPINPVPLNDSISLAMQQAMSIRQHYVKGGSLSPQDSFKYDPRNYPMNSTEILKWVFILRSTQPLIINGTLRATFNGISFINPDYPIRLADQFNNSKIYDLDFPNATLLSGPPRMATSLIAAPYKGFIEFIFQNNDAVVQSFHMDGYSFFVVGMGPGEWTEKSRQRYNYNNGISRSTTQVFPGGWTAVMVYLDNVGVWNLRAENLDRWYLGQETYMRVVDPQEDNATVFNGVPDNVIYCGAIKDLEKPKKTASSVASIASIVGQSKLYVALLMVFSASISILC